MNKIARSAGLLSSAICTLSFIVWIVSFIGIAVSSALFRWTNINDYINFVNTNSQFFQYLAKPFMIVFSLSFLVLILVFTEFVDNERKLLAKISVTFSVMFALLSSMHYFVQVSAVRFSVISGQLDGIEHFLQANPTSFLSAANMLAWTFFLGFSSLFMHSALKTGRLSKTVRIGLLLNGISCLMAGFGYLIQNDVITFLFINIGLGGALITVVIGALIFFIREKVKNYFLIKNN